MPYVHVKFLIPPKYDRRRKITIVDRVKMHLMYFIDGQSINGIARHFGVNKRSVQFILFPERLQKNKEDREARGGWKQYYDRGQHTETQREHRRYKQSLYLRGLLAEPASLNTSKGSEK